MATLKLVQEAAKRAIRMYGKGGTPWEEGRSTELRGLPGSQ